MGENDQYSKADDIRQQFSWAMAQEFNSHAVNNATIVLRTLIVVNGGAAVAVLAFVSSLVAADSSSLVHGHIAELINPLIWFGWGLVAAIFAMAFAYFTHYSTAAAMFSYADGEFRKGNVIGWMKRVLHLSALISTFASLGLFIYALYDVRASVINLAM